LSSKDTLLPETLFQGMIHHWGMNCNMLH